MRRRRYGLVLAAAAVLIVAGCDAAGSAVGGDPGKPVANAEQSLPAEQSQPAEQGEPAEQDGDSGGPETYCALLEENGDALSDLGADAANGDPGERAVVEDAMNELAAAAPGEIKPAMNTIVTVGMKLAYEEPAGQADVAELAQAIQTFSTWVTENCEDPEAAGAGIGG